VGAKNKQCLYGLPVYPGILPQLTELCKAIRIQLLIDNEQQLAILERSNPEKPWDVFIKLDVGSHRAGVTPDSPALHSLIRAAEACPAVRVYGIYCHANHSYGGRTRAEAEDTLRVELDSAVGAAKLLPGDREIVASVGATPTAHVVESLKAHVPANVKLELHAGT
jgi:D-serine deaminase-like pyridoxal phosphate-dependent protein